MEWQTNKNHLVFIIIRIQSKLVWFYNQIMFLLKNKKGRIYKNIIEKKK